jgi:hypothetical protein
VGAEQGTDMNGAVGLRAKAGRLADVEVCLLSNAQVRQQTFELRRHDTTNLGKCTTPYSGYQTPDPRPLEKCLLPTSYNSSTPSVPTPSMPTPGMLRCALAQSGIGG